MQYYFAHTFASFRMTIPYCYIKVKRFKFYTFPFSTQLQSMTIIDEFSFQTISQKSSKVLGLGP